MKVAYFRPDARIVCGTHSEFRGRGPFPHEHDGEAFWLARPTVRVTCDICGEGGLTPDRSDVALLCELRASFAASGVESHLDQTGGMCVALVVEGARAHYVFTEDEDHEGPGYLMGVYPGEAYERGGESTAAVYFSDPCDPAVMAIIGADRDDGTTDLLVALVDDVVPDEDRAPADPPLPPVEQLLDQFARSGVVLKQLSTLDDVGAQVRREITEARATIDALEKSLLEE